MVSPFEGRFFCYCDRAEGKRKETNEAYYIVAVSALFPLNLMHLYVEIWEKVADLGANAVDKTVSCVPVSPKMHSTRE